MSISSVASTSQVQTQDGLSITMLRKSLDQQQAVAQQMIESLPPVTPAPDPTATVGRSVDTYA